MIARPFPGRKVFAPIPALFVVMWMCACSKSNGTQPFEMPEPPNPASLPDFLPCPDGWREQPAGSPEQVATCDPWPDTGIESCASAGEAHFPGTPGCAAIGTACPVGDFADDLPVDQTVWYVLAGAPAGGDGSLGDPFDKVAVAMTVASGGDIVALSKGDHPEALSLTMGVHIWGACVEQTRIVPVGFSVDAAVAVRARNVILQDVQITAPRPGISVELGAVALLRGVLVHNSEYFGLVVQSGGRASGSRFVVRDMLPRSSDMAAGGGVQVQTEGSIDFDQIAVERVVDVGLQASGSMANIKIDDFVVRETAVRASDGTRGFGLELEDGGGAVIRRAVFERNSERAVSVTGTGTALLAQYVVARDTQARTSDGLAGHAFFAMDGADYFMRYVLFDNHRDAAIVVHGSAAQSQVADAVVRNTAERPDGTGGSAIVVDDTGTFEIVRFFAEQASDRAVLISGGSTVYLQDGWVRDTKSRSSDDRGGYGFEINDASYADLTRVVFQRNHGVGVFVAGARTTLETNDVIVEQTQSYDSDGTSGCGMVVVDASFAHMHRTVVRDNRDIGVFISGQGSRIEGGDLVVSGTSPQQCAATNCTLSGGGIGVGAYDSAHALLESFVLADNALAGAQLESGGTMDFHVGRNERHPIGVNTQDVEFDNKRLLDRIDYVENMEDFDDSPLPVPVVN